MLASVVISCSSVFFFKQKTAYEMRISDWSSDVCSSDLPGINELVGAGLLKDDDSDLAQVARRAALQSLLGLTGGLAGIGGSAGNTLFGLVINAVKSDTGSNLLSTTSIMTLDIEPARILVGQEVPVTSRSDEHKSELQSLMRNSHA